MPHRLLVRCKGSLFACLLLGSILHWPGASTAAPEDHSAEELFELSLEQLHAVKLYVPAAITKLTRLEQPASITTISADDIRYAPARNIFDLIEIYVPGALWMNSEEGPLLGMRGNLVNRNFKYLLLVNGRVMNSKAHFGAKSELEQWDLSDIESIEIVRGPGSVTYGAGAVSGVISITTADSESNRSGGFAVRGFSKYNSRGLTFQDTYNGGLFKLFTFASITKTDGYSAPHFIVDDNDMLGYIGTDLQTDTEPLDYFSDYQDEPQLKLHLDSTIGEHWRLWFRYTQQGSTWRGNEAKTLFNGIALNQQSVRDRQWTATLSYKNNIHENLDFTSTVSIDSFDAERRGGKARDPDPESALNFKQDFSETEIFLHTQLNWNAGEDLEIALGAEYSRDRFGAGWNDDDRNMRLGGNNDIINGPDSNALSPMSLGSADRNGPATYVGSGWNMDTYALFAEANIALSPKLISLLSVRADKTSYSDWLWSPRAVLIHELTEGQDLKFIAQQSQRFNTASQILIESRQGEKASSESLTGFEIAYSAYLKSGLILNSAVFWNDMEIISWNGDDNLIQHVGDLKLGGIEFELEHHWQTGKIGANYSIVKQIDWELDSSLTRSGISYSDYRQPLQNTTAIQTGVGNDLNNWPNQAIKFYYQWKPTSNLVLHLDAHLLWDFQGAKDGITGLKNAVRGLPEEQGVLQAVDAVEAKDVYDHDFRLNGSVSYKFSSGIEAILYAQNLVGSNNYRYAEDSGNSSASPRRVRFVEEARVYGLKVDIGF